MTTEEIGKRLFILLIATVTMCLMGSFVVSLNLIDFLYLIVLYTYIFLCYRSKKS